MGLLEDKTRARIFYKYLSRVYDLINPFIWTEAMRTEALEMVEWNSTDRVLDVGCGTGFATMGLLERAQDVHGIDQSRHQLRQAWDKIGKLSPVSFYLGDAERLPFADGAFDVVWSSGSIEYWPDPVATLTEIRRVTKPGGYVVIVGPNAPKSRIMRRIASAIMLFYSPREADRMFRAAGFDEFEHRLMGPAYRPQIAITTVARIPA